MDADDDGVEDDHPYEFGGCESDVVSKLSSASVARMQVRKSMKTMNSLKTSNCTLERANCTLEHELADAKDEIEALRFELKIAREAHSLNRHRLSASGDHMPRRTSVMTYKTSKGSKCTEAEAPLTRVPGMDELYIRLETLEGEREALREERDCVLQERDAFATACEESIAAVEEQLYAYDEECQRLQSSVVELEELLAAEQAESAKAKAQVEELQEILRSGAVDAAAQALELEHPGEGFVGRVPSLPRRSSGQHDALPGGDNFGGESPNFGALSREVYMRSVLADEPMRMTRRASWPPTYSRQEIAPVSAHPALPQASYAAHSPLAAPNTAIAAAASFVDQVDTTQSRRATPGTPKPSKVAFSFADEADATAGSGDGCSDCGPDEASKDAGGAEPRNRNRRIGTLNDESRKQRGRARKAEAEAAKLRARIEELKNQVHKSKQETKHSEQSYAEKDDSIPPLFPKGLFEALHVATQQASDTIIMNLVASEKGQVGPSKTETASPQAASDDNDGVPSSLFNIGGILGGTEEDVNGGCQSPIPSLFPEGLLGPAEEEETHQRKARRLRSDIHPGVLKAAGDAVLSIQRMDSESKRRNAELDPVVEGLHHCNLDISGLSAAVNTRDKLRQRRERHKCTAQSDAPGANVTT
eukprot:TRINITY_DN20668_c0_g1_i1.p1 TRINITY_DN20668_c0_g1~~TRINITY_DN20668_c0_g1_i1.p1  ORF type:complete len:647 (+),score=100.49 TRINITY_DN20668_c0_g1_i1:88-2028(+)